MPSFQFFWYDENRKHVEEHDVMTDEFEGVVCDPLRVKKKATPAIGWSPLATLATVGSWLAFTR